MTKKRRLVLFGLLLSMLLGGLSVSTAEDNLDTLIVPGKQVGPVTSMASHESLAKRFGHEKVKKGTFYVGEGYCLAGTVLFPDEPEKRLEILWGDKIHQAKPTNVQWFGEKSVWLTNQGVGLGTTVKELEALNGKPFKLSGLGWDYGGYISSWEAGKLNVNMPIDSVMIRLYEAEYVGNPPEDIYGEQTISSTQLKPIEDKFFVGKINLVFTDNFNAFPTAADDQRDCLEFEESR